jgi:class 3 adenylate cyclase
VIDTGAVPTGSLIEWVGGERATLAIVFTDIVGSTALANRLGDTRMRKVQQAHFARSDLLLDQHAGREIRTIGDALLAVFRSVNDAFDYAHALHLDPGHEELQPGGVRAGIHIGSVEIAAKDIFGLHVALRPSVRRSSDPSRRAP